jgi:hypothetical protein
LASRSARSPSLSLPSGTAPSAPLRTRAHPLSLAHSPRVRPVPSPATAVSAPMACSPRTVKPRRRPHHPPMSLEHLGEDSTPPFAHPCLSFSLSLPSCSLSPQRRPLCHATVLPSSLGLCRRLSLGELRRSPVHLEPAVVPPPHRSLYSVRAQPLPCAGQRSPPPRFLVAQPTGVPSRHAKLPQAPSLGK